MNTSLSDLPIIEINDTELTFKAEALEIDFEARCIDSKIEIYVPGSGQGAMSYLQGGACAPIAIDNLKTFITNLTHLLRTDLKDGQATLLLEESYGSLTFKKEWESEMSRWHSFTSWSLEINLLYPHRYSGRLVAGCYGERVATYGSDLLRIMEQWLDAVERYFADGSKKI